MTITGRCDRVPREEGDKSGCDEGRGVWSGMVREGVIGCDAGREVCSGVVKRGSRDQV